MLNKIALLANPAASNGTALPTAVTARDRFQSLGVEVVSTVGLTAKDSLQQVEECLQQDFDAIVVCGGDGMINLALQKMAFSGVPLGIIPAGTGNDHARAYGIPLDPKKAADALVQGKTKTTDLGKLTAVNNPENTRIFGTIACQGFDSLVNERTNKMTWPSGPLRYNVASLVEISTFTSIPTRVSAEDADFFMELDATLVAIGNTTSYGGGANICPNANPTDGQFDVTIIHGMNRVEAMKNLPKYFRGDGHDEKYVTTFHTNKLRVEMGRKIPTYCDGEHFHPTPIEAEILPDAGLYLVP